MLHFIYMTLWSNTPANVWTYFAKGHERLRHNTPTNEDTSARFWSCSIKYIGFRLNVSIANLYQRFSKICLEWPWCWSVKCLRLHAPMPVVILKNNNIKWRNVDKWLSSCSEARHGTKISAVIVATFHILHIQPCSVNRVLPIDTTMIMCFRWDFLGIWSARDLIKYERGHFFLIWFIYLTSRCSD